MGMLVWVMVGLAIWHFTVWLPDNFYGGIVGAFVGALLGTIIIGLIIHVGSIPGRHDTDLLTALEAIPGAVIGLGASWLLGVREIRQQQAQHTGLA